MVLVTHIQLLCVFDMNSKRILLLMVILVSGCSSEENRDIFIKIFEHCRETDIEGRVGQYSQRSLAWNLGNILSETSEEEREKDLTIAKNRVNTCLEPKVVDSYEYLHKDGDPQLRVNYRNNENEVRYIQFTFGKESGKWVITFVNQGVVQLAN